MVSLELGVAIIALLVSLVSFEVNRRAASAAERHGRMPILVPQPIADAAGQAPSRMVIRNIGNGPALNIVMADATGTLAKEDVRSIRLSRSKHRTLWSGYKHLRPIPAGAEASYKWTWKEAVGLSYTDALGSAYTLLTSAYGTKVVEGAIIPHQSLNALDYADDW
jgi:hypothetical protein